MSDLPPDWTVAGEPVGPERRVGFVAMTAGVESLVRELRETRRAVEDDRSLRRLLTFLLATVLLTMLLLGIYGSVALGRVTDTQTENHRLLQTVERVTNPDAVAAQQKATADAVNRIVECVENHQDRLVDPKVPLVDGCPPGAPTTTTTVPPTTTTTEQRASRSASRAPLSSPNWAALAACESGDTNADTGNGFFGYFQFNDSTWRSVTGRSDHASDAGYDEQQEAAAALYAQRGAQPWPVCGYRLTD